MSINSIKVLGKNKLGLFNNELKIDFENQNVVSVIGKNGSGKSMFLRDLHKQLLEVNSAKTDRNEYIHLNKSLKKKDLDILKEKANDEVKFNKKMIKDFNDLLDQCLKNKEHLYKSDLIDELNIFFYNKLLTSLNGLKNELSSSFLKRINGTKFNKKFTDFVNVIHQYKGINTNEIILNIEGLTKINIDQFSSIRQFIEDRIGIINPIYIDCMSANNGVDLSFVLETTYINEINQISANSLISEKNRLLFNILSNSIVKPEKFRKMGIDKIFKLNSNSEFIKSVQDYFYQITSQPLNFKLEFIKNKNFYNYNYNETLHCRLHVMDYIENKHLKFDDLSSGTKVLLKILSLIPRVDSQSILILDEPEIGMHPVMQVEVNRMLRRLAKITQARMIFSTHSMYFINKDLDGVYVCYRKRRKNDNKISLNKIETEEKYQYIIPAKDFINKHAMNEEKQLYEMIMYIPYFELMKYTKTGKNILVEGATDVIYLNHFAKLFSLTEEDVAFIPPPTYSKGYNGIIESHKQLETLNLNKENIFIACDADVKEANPNIVKKFEKMVSKKRFIEIGKDGKSIESLFEGEDVKFASSENASYQKMRKAQFFQDEVEQLSQLDNRTISNFKEIFIKFGFKIEG